MIGRPRLSCTRWRPRHCRLTPSRTSHSSLSVRWIDEGRAGLPFSFGCDRPLSASTSQAGKETGSLDAQPGRNSIQRGRSSPSAVSMNRVQVWASASNPPARESVAEQAGPHRAVLDQVVTDHDSEVLARKTFRLAGWDQRFSRGRGSESGLPSGLDRRAAVCNIGHAHAVRVAVSVRRTR